jgi:hypothetical protein
MASFIGGLIGAGCVLIAVYVTNTKALSIHDAGLEPAVNALHSRINDFYIFSGIVITLLLAINVGVFVRADDEVDRQIRESLGKHQEEIMKIVEDYRNLYSYLKEREKDLKIKKQKNGGNKNFDTEL